MFRRLARRLKILQLKQEAREISVGSFYFRVLLYSVLVFSAVTVGVSKIFLTQEDGDQILELKGILPILCTLVGAGIVYSVIMIVCLCVMIFKHGERLY